MNTARAARPIVRCDRLPDKPPRDPLTFKLAPELGVLCMLDDALHIARVALVAVHPAIEDLAGPREPPTQRRARCLAAATLDLRKALDRYRRAVLDDLMDAPSTDDDIPF